MFENLATGMRFGLGRIQRSVTVYGVTDYIPVTVAGQVVGTITARHSTGHSRGVGGDWTVAFDFRDYRQPGRRFPTYSDAVAHIRSVVG